MTDTQERVTATSISQMLNNVGQGVNIKITIVSIFVHNPKVSFLIASLMVDEPSSHPPHTHHVNATSAIVNTTSEATQFKVIAHSVSSVFKNKFLSSGPGRD